MSKAERRLGDGTVAQGVVQLAEDGRIVNPIPEFHQDLVGNARNPYPDAIRGFVFGKKTLVQNVHVDLWSGPTGEYIFPTEPMQMLIKSTSDEDSAAGTGIRSLYIHYLNDKYEISFVITSMNGIAGVLTLPENILRINNVHAASVGSTGAAVGTISITSADGSVTYCVMNIGEAESRQCIYTVPDGYHGYINHWQQSSGSAGNHFCQQTLVATCHDGILFPGIFLIQDEAGSQNGGYPINFPIPIPIPPRTDVKIRAISDANNANVTALAAIMGWFDKI